MLSDTVLYAGPLVVDVGGGGIRFLVRLHVCAAMGSYSLVLLLSRKFMGLGMALCILGYDISITGTLGDAGIAACIFGVSVYSIIDTLRDVCVFICASVCVKMWGCSVVDFLLVAGAWRLIKLSASVASRLRSLIDVSPFPFYTPLADFLRL